MENEKDIADRREQILEQAFAAAKNGNMDQAQALYRQVARPALASRYALLERMGLFDEDDQINKD
jgi:hypothetical protein